MTPRSRYSRKQPFLLLNAHTTVDAFQHQAGGNLGEFFGFDFVEPAAVDAALRNQLGGFANRFFTVPFGIESEQGSRRVNKVTKVPSIHSMSHWD
jgi:hypothetical protein